MDQVNCFMDLVEYILDYRKTMLSMFLIKSDVDVSPDSSILKKDFGRLCMKLQKYFK